MPVTKLAVIPACPPEADMSGIFLQKDSGLILDEAKTSQDNIFGANTISSFFDNRLMIFLSMFAFFRNNFYIEYITFGGTKE
jgi:hypothetical protein